MLMANRTITSVKGCLGGHWTNDSGTTGATAILFMEGAHAGYFIAGQSACTRQLTAMGAGHVADRVHGFCLSGGSGFGLSAADGVMRALAERQVGFNAGDGLTIPIVPAASLFDGCCSPPTSDSGFWAASAASDCPLAEGRVGAGAGARVGPERRVAGGMGSWSVLGDPYVVAACTAVNAYGSIRNPETGSWVLPPPSGELAPIVEESDWNHHTTLSIIVTDWPLNRVQLNVVAQMAAAALARTIWPAFTLFDGDVIFAASTASSQSAGSASNSDVKSVGVAAVDCLTEAVLRAVDRTRSVT